jgi:hypothetical protein
VLSAAPHPASAESHSRRPASPMIQ